MFNLSKNIVDASMPKAVFICNTPLHVFNAIQAAYTWGLDTNECILVLKVITEKINLSSALEKLAPWKKVIKIDPFPLPPRIEETGYRKQIIQFRFFRGWQKELDVAIGCDYVFLCHNRQRDNKVIASYLEARELIWLEDGTLSYSMWLEERLVSLEKREARERRQAERSTSTRAKSTTNKKTLTTKPAVVKNTVNKKTSIKEPSIKGSLEKKQIAGSIPADSKNKRRRNGSIRKITTSGKRENDKEI